MMYFCYEMSGHRNKWSPVIYYYKPAAKSQQGYNFTRSAVVEINSDDTRFVHNGEPMFGALQAAYPAPIVEPIQPMPAEIPYADMEYAVINQALKKFNGKLLVIS